MQSVAERIANLPPELREEALSHLSPGQYEATLQDWEGFLARPEQIAPKTDWDIWLILAGRGFGKTEAGARWVDGKEKQGARTVALVAETQKDLEEVMVPRLLAINPQIVARFRPVKLTWPSGAVAYGYVGNAPDQLRGPEFDTAWVDELAKYRYARETWDMLQFGMRKGQKPQTCVTTTPRPTEIIKALASGKEGTVEITRGSTLDNASNLPASFIKKITDRYAGTRLGRQEINAEILGDLPGALWSQGDIDAYRVQSAPALLRAVVSIDPAVTSNEESNDHGIIVAGRDAEQTAYVLEDTSLSGSPIEWAKAAIAAYHRHQADAIVAEVNQGGDMVAHTIRAVAPSINVIEVRASRGKHTRAEPIAALYPQGRVRHVGQFPELENQMTQFTNEGYQGDDSPDRADALVWAISELFPDIVEPIPDASKLKLTPQGRSWLS